jgi:Autophagy-related protein 27
MLINQIGELHLRTFNEGVLRLDWQTKYACPTSADKPSNDDPSSPATKHWGFLTWLIVMYIHIYTEV